MPNDVPDWTEQVSPQPRDLGTVNATVPNDVTQTITLPQGTQCVAWRAKQTAGGSFTGSPSLEIDDGDGFQYILENPLLRGSWSAVAVVPLPSNAITVILKTSGMTGSGVTMQVELVALPWAAVVGVTTLAGSSLALKASGGNLIMATADDVVAYGRVVAPGAGGVIVASPTLAAGHYWVRGNVGYGTTASTEDDMKLVLAGVLTYRQLRVPAVANGVGVPFNFRYLNVSQSGVVRVEAIAGGAAGTVYWGSLDITAFTQV